MFSNCRLESNIVVTQIVGYPRKAKEIMARKAKTTIDILNNNETDWKIQTNQQKFKIL